MIYFRRINGNLGSVSYDSLELDLEMISKEKRIELRTDIIGCIDTKHSQAAFNLLKPQVKSPYLVCINNPDYKEPFIIK